jgi:acyl transferase domain-containing protein
MGAFFPSSECQRDLLLITYKEANINPLDVNYFEAHRTGTKVFIINSYYLVKNLIS